MALGLVVGAAACEPRPARRPADPSASPTTGVGTHAGTGTDTDRAATEPGCKGTGSTAQSDLRYRSTPGVAADLQSLDLYLPTRPEACGAAPLVVYIHGGGFSVGDKANKITDKRTLFTGEGWVFASINYRLSPRPASDDPDRVMHPDHSEDVAAAIAWLLDRADTYEIDPRRIVVMGHSAGAFLAALATTDPSYLAAAGVDLDQVRCAVPLDTRYDVVAEAATSASARAMYTNAFGSDPAVWAEVSPVNQAVAKRGMPDFFIVVQGTAARIGASHDFAAAVRRGQSEATVLDARPLDHEGVNAAVGQAGDTKVTPPLMSFLRRCLDPDARRPR